MDNLNFEPWKKKSGGVRINDIFKTKSGQIAQFPLCNMPVGNHGSYCMQKKKQNKKNKKTCARPFSVLQLKYFR